MATKFLLSSDSIISPMSPRSAFTSSRGLVKVPVALSIVLTSLDMVLAIWLPRRRRWPRPARASWQLVDELWLSRPKTTHSPAKWPRASSRRPWAARMPAQWPGSFLGCAGIKDPRQDGFLKLVQELVPGRFFSIRQNRGSLCAPGRSKPTPSYKPLSRCGLPGRDRAPHTAPALYAAAGHKNPFVVDILIRFPVYLVADAKGVYKSGKGNDVGDSADEIIGLGRLRTVGRG